jgi:hypothetical protein
MTLAERSANRDAMTNPYTYADAGVSIAAGNALVKRIAPLARATARPGAGAELGGSAGFFDLKAAGYRDPLLVAANDGVGTKLKLAIDADGTTASASTSSRCAPTTWSCRARSRCSFSTISAAGGWTASSPKPWSRASRRAAASPAAR